MTNWWQVCAIAIAIGVGLNIAGLHASEQPAKFILVSLMLNGVAQYPWKR